MRHSSFLSQYVFMVEESLVALLRILHLPLHPFLLYITNTDSAGISLSTRGTTSKIIKKKKGSSKSRENFDEINIFLRRDRVVLW
jgi:hypothetical protein